MGGDNRQLLLVDDDLVFCEVLGRALQRREFVVSIAHDVPQALAIAPELAPDFVVLDLCMPGPSGLKLIEDLLKINARARIVVLTGYASIATAVEAIKLGATHYLTKPADANQIVAAFSYERGDTDTALPTQPMSVNRHEWEYLQSVLVACNGNISAAARELGMHRRTLQRKLNKHPVAK